MAAALLDVEVLMVLCRAKDEEVLDFFSIDLKEAVVVDVDFFCTFCMVLFLLTWSTSMASMLTPGWICSVVSTFSDICCWWCSWKEVRTFSTIIFKTDALLFRKFPHHHHLLIFCDGLISADSLSKPQLCCPASKLSLVGTRRGPAHSFDPVQVWFVVHLQNMTGKMYS